MKTIILLAMVILFVTCYAKKVSETQTSTEWKDLVRSI